VVLREIRIETGIRFAFNRVNDPSIPQKRILSEYHRNWVEEILKNGTNQCDAKYLGTSYKIITFYPFISSNCMALAIFSPRFTEMLTDGCETPSFFDSSVVLISNLLTAQ